MWSGIGEYFREYQKMDFKLRDVPVGKKLIGGFILVLLLTAFIGYTGYTSLLEMESRVDKMNDAASLADFGNMIRGEAKNFIIQGEDGYYGGRSKKTLTFYDEVKTDISAKIEELRGKLQVQQDIDNLKILEKSFTDYDTSMQHLITAYEKRKLAQEHMDEVGAVLMTETNALIADQGDKLKREIASEMPYIEIAERDRLLKESNNLLDTVNSMRMDAKNIIVYGDKKYEDSLHKDHDIAFEITEDLKADFTDTDNIKQSNNILKALDEYELTAEAYIDSENDASKASADAGIAGETFDEATSALHDSQLKAMKEGEAAAINQITIFSMLTIFAGIVIAVVMTRLITQPLNRLREIVDSLAKNKFGELPKIKEVVSKDEIGQIAASTGRLGGVLVGLVEGITDPLFITNENLTVTFVNESAQKALGYSAGEVINNMNCGSMCKTPLCNTSDCTIKNCIKTRSAIVGETTIKTKSGETRDIRACCNALFDLDGNPMGGFELVQDITEAKMVARDLNAKAQEFAATSEELSSAAEEVNASNEQVTSTVQEMAKGAQDQSKALEETTKIVSSVSLNAKSVSEASGEARELAKRAGMSATKGQEMGQKASKKMDELSNAMGASAEAVNALDEKGQKIGDIVDTITRIAEQTNLLALNAAIEAARAGEAGRGFAVVADEVRKLAEESSTAAGQIEGIIKEMVESTKSTSDSMSTGVKTLQETNEAVTVALNELANIAEISKQVEQKVEDVTGKSDEASKGTESISKTVQELSSTAEENAAAAEEVSASTEETAASMNQVAQSAQTLARMSEELKSLGAMLIGEDSSKSGDGGKNNSGEKSQKKQDTAKKSAGEKTGGGGKPPHQGSK